MTTIYVHCPWCEHDVELTPADIVLTARNQRSTNGVYRWFHCGQLITRPANERVMTYLLLAGCRIELTDDVEVAAFSEWLDEISTPAEMFA